VEGVVRDGVVAGEGVVGPIGRGGGEGWGAGKKKL
jgi:hypothetical protein